jgi:hypothetical protein
MTHALHCRGLAVHPEAREALLQKVDQVAAVSASRIEYPAARVEPSAKDLIEEVDVDVAELGSKLAACSHAISGSRVA